MVERYASAELQAADEMADLSNAVIDQRSCGVSPFLLRALSLARIATRKAKASIASVTWRYQPCQLRISWLLPGFGVVAPSAAAITLKFQRNSTIGRRHHPETR